MVMAANDLFKRFDKPPPLEEPAHGRPPQTSNRYPGKRPIKARRRHGQKHGQMASSAEIINDFSLHLRTMYQPMAHVALHKHRVQEQVYHVLEGEGLMEIDGNKHVVRKHDVIFLPPGIEHSINNTGLVDLVYLVVTSPVTNDGA